MKEVVMKCFIAFILYAFVIIWVPIINAASITEEELRDDKGNVAKAVLDAMTAFEERKTLDDVKKALYPILSVSNLKVENRFSYSTYYENPTSYTYYSDDGKFSNTTYYPGGYRTKSNFNGLEVSFTIKNKTKAIMIEAVVVTRFQTQGDLWVTGLNVIGKFLNDKDLKKSDFSFSQVLINVGNLAPGESKKVFVLLDNFKTKKSSYLLEPICLPLFSFLEIDYNTLRESNLKPEKLGYPRADWSQIFPNQ